MDGLTYLVSLDDGLPRIPNIESYVRIVKDKSVLRQIAIAGQQMMNRALMAEENPAEILTGAEQTIRALTDARVMPGGIRSPEEIIAGFPGGINTFLNPSSRASGLSTGFTRLDEMSGGLHDGDLAILAARPSMGKTAMALNIAWNVAVRLSQPVVVFSFEMSAQSLLTRVLCSAARVDSQRLRAGYLNEQERQKLREAARAIMEAPFYIDDSSDGTVSEMGAKLRKFEAKNAQTPRLAVVDYLQLMVASKTRRAAENRNQEVSAMTRGLKLLAKDLNYPFLVLSQLSRAPETRTGDHRPQLSDLRESGSIEQDSDLVAFIFREEVYKRDREDLRGVAELIVAKQRNGPIGKIDLVFLHAMTKFENRAEDLGDLVPDAERRPYAD